MLCSKSSPEHTLYEGQACIYGNTTFPYTSIFYWNAANFICLCIECAREISLDQSFTANGFAQYIHNYYKMDVDADIEMIGDFEDSASNWSDETSNSSSESEESANDENNRNVGNFSNKISDDLFVKMLSKYPVLLDKSQNVVKKAQKKIAIDSILKRLREKHLIITTENNFKKKLDNMKQNLKKKVDLKRTGNKPINLKEHEETLLKLMDYENNPTLSQIEGLY